MSISDEQDASSIEPSPPAVRVAWPPERIDFNDMRRKQLDREGDELIEKARPFAPFAVAASPAAKPSGKRRRAIASGTAIVPGGGDRPAAAAPIGSAGAPASEGGGGDPPDGPRAMGYDVKALNREYAAVMLGGDAVIFQETPTAGLVENRLRVLRLRGFKAWFANRFTEVRGHGGRVKRLTWGERWWADSARREYQGVEFYPDPDNKPGTPGFLNLWRGFAVKPAPDWTGNIIRFSAITF